MMRIGLLGYKVENENLGCVALTYTTIAILRELCPKNLTVIVFSDCRESLDFIQQSFSDLTIELFFCRLHTKYLIMDFKTMQAIRKCDLVMDITYGDNFSDIYMSGFVHRTTKMKLWVEALKIPLILMPQTVGPFKEKCLRKEAICAIKKSARIYVRDKLSMEFINQYLPNKDVFITTDLAMALPYSRPIENKKKSIRVGINVSGLLWRGGFDQNNQFGLEVNYQEYISKLIERLLCCRKYEIHLIPHVIETVMGANDGDIKVCQQLHKRYPELHLAQHFHTPIEAKNYISKMDVFTGARMHATIAAFSSCIATIPFAYSRKFEGLYTTLKYPYLIDGCKMSTDEAVTKTVRYVDDYKKLTVAVCTSMKTVNKQLYSFKLDLKEAIKKYGG